MHAQHLHLHLSVPTGAECRWGPAKHHWSHSPLGAKELHLFRKSSVPKSLFYVLLSSFSSVSCCATAPATLSTVSLESQLNIQILANTFIFQSYVLVISINNHNPLALICHNPLKFQQLCKMINPLIAILSAQMDTSPRALLSLWLRLSLWNQLEQEWLSSPDFPPPGRQGKSSLFLQYMPPFRLTTSHDCRVNLVMTAQL